MNKNIDRMLIKIGLAAIITILLVIIICGVILLLVESPNAYPEVWLESEKILSNFFQRITLPIKLANLTLMPPDNFILMPVYGIKARDIEDSWQSPRPDGRSHEGQDIFADRGVPVFSATEGVILRIGTGDLGGNLVYVAGAGGRRYYYAHLDRIADGINRGTKVTVDTVLGYVGNTGNAENTPPHLHFGVYVYRKAIDPLPLIINR